MGSRMSSEAALVRGAPTPMVSVVIPYGGGIELLNKQLAKLAAQDYRLPFEIILSCNRDLLSEAELVAEFPPEISVRVVDAREKRGPSYARNIGWQNARGDIVLFCDSDDEVHETWISSLSEALQTCEVVGGALVYSRINQPSLASWHKQLQDGPSRKFDHLDFVPSCNLGIRKRILQEVGGFRVDLACGEDIDLSWRIQYAGYKLCFSSGAKIDYRLRDGYLSLFQQYFAYGVSDAALLHLHTSNGARRRLSATCADLAAVGLALAKAPFGRAPRLKATTRVANLIGRAYGSLVGRVWAI